MAPLATGLSNVDTFNDGAPELPIASATNTASIVVNGERITSIEQWDRLRSGVQRKVLLNRANARVIDAMYERQEHERAWRRGPRS
jgi:hypothetical protein